MIDVLIIDDDGQRVEVLKETVLREATSAGVEVRIADAGTTAHGRRFLAEKHFDLLVVDIVLPVHDEGRPRPGGGLSLVEEIFRTSVLNRPTLILGISAHRESVQSALEIREELVWDVILVDSLRGDWLDKVASLTEHAALTSVSEPKRPNQSDVMWLTALREPELEAVIQPRDSWIRKDAAEGEPAFFLKPASTGTSSVAALCCSQMGNVEAALVTQLGLRAFAPDVAVLSGICGGLEGEVRLGDLVVARDVWDWQGGKHTDNGFVPDVNVVNSSRELLEMFNELRCDREWLARMWSSYNGQKPDHPPEIHIGSIASGSLVVASADMGFEIREHKRKTIAVDMEAFGFQYACETSTLENLKFVTAKGVSDLANSKKEDSFQRYAAFVSASAFKYVLGLS